MTRDSNAARTATELSARWRSLLVLLLFLAAFVPRAVCPVSRPLQWYERSSRFSSSVLQARWADTIVSEHPGVTAMWLIGSAQHAYETLRRASGDAEYVLREVDKAFRTEVFVSILPLALTISLGIALAWFLLRELFGAAAAWGGAGFLALDPFHIAMSKVVHVDALLSTLMLLSALLLLVYLRRAGESQGGGGFWLRHRMMVASGVLGGLAFLTKSPAYFLVPYLGLCLVFGQPRAALVRGYLLPAAVWIGAAAITYVACWPAMWVQPIQTLATVFAGVVKHAGRAHPQPLFYLGRLVTDDPGPGYYLTSVLVKSTALTLPLFFVGLLCPVARTWRRERRSALLLIGYVVFFFAQMSLGAKKAPRYLLPLFPAFAVIAGLGLVTLARWLGSVWRRFGPSLLVLAGLVAQAALVLPYHPYYVIHANLLTGGPSGAQDLLIPTPEGEGLDRAAAYLNGLPGAEALRVGVQLAARETFQQHFVGATVDTRADGLDYLVFAPVYVRRGLAQDQWGEQWEQYRFRLPVFTVRLRGAPYAWVYAVDGPRTPAKLMRVCLGPAIQMEGYTLVRDGAQLDGDAAGVAVVRPGDVLLLSLHWLAVDGIEGDYSVFVHLVAADGSIAAQQDNAPLRGTYPTFLWEPGERVDDPFELIVPSDATDGLYQLQVGIYDWRSRQRLAATARCEEPLPDDAVPVAQIAVRRRRVPWWQVLVWVGAGVLVLGGAASCVVGRRRLRGPG